MITVYVYAQIREKHYVYSTIEWESRMKDEWP